MSDSINQRQIQWFPGHMAKTLRLIGTELRHVDAVVEHHHAALVQHADVEAQRGLQPEPGA